MQQMVTGEITVKTMNHNNYASKFNVGFADRVVIHSYIDPLPEDKSSNKKRKKGSFSNYQKLIAEDETIPAFVMQNHADDCRFKTHSKNASTKPSTSEEEFETIEGHFTWAANCFGPSEYNASSPKILFLANYSYLQYTDCKNDQHLLSSS